MARRPRSTAGLSPQPQLVATVRGVIEVRPDPNVVPHSVRELALIRAKQDTTQEGYRLGYGQVVSSSTWGNNVQVIFERGMLIREANVSPTIATLTQASAKTSSDQAGPPTPQQGSVAALWDCLRDE